MLPAPRTTLASSVPCPLALCPCGACNARGEYNFNLPEAREEISFENGTRLHPPQAVICKVTAAQFRSAILGIGIIIEGINASSQPPCGQTEEPAARASVEKIKSGEVVHFQHIPERLLRTFDALVVQSLQKSGPIPAKFDALTRRDFFGVRVGGVDHHGPLMVAMGRAGGGGVGVARGGGLWGAGMWGWPGTGG